MTSPWPPAALSAHQRAFIEGQRIARFATVDGEGKPHVVPICFCLIGDHLYTPIDEKPKRGSPANLRRIRNIAASPNVQVLFDVYDDRDWTTLRYLQLRGTASLIDDAAQRASVFAALRARYVQYEHMSLEERPIIRIAIERVVEWIAAELRS